MKPILVIKFNVNIAIGSEYSIVDKMSAIDDAFRDRFHDYNLLVLPAKPEDTPFFDVAVLNADKIDPIEFDQLRKEIDKQLTFIKQ